MSYIYTFKDTPVRFYFTGQVSPLSVTNVSFSTTNNITPVKSLGKKQAYFHQVTSDSVIHNVNITYNIQNDDPIANVIADIKNRGYAFTTNAITDTSSFASTSSINIGGLLYTGLYLDNFSFSVEPNSIVSAQASFFTYDPPSGQIGSDYTYAGGLNNQNFLHGSRMLADNAYYGGTLLTPDTYETQVENYDELFSIGYNFKAEYLPVKILNYRRPKTVKLNGASEEFEMSESLYRRILYTGESRDIKFNLQAICCPSTNYVVRITGAQAVSVEGSSAVNGITTAKRRFTKFY
jgi:hypothetical protein